MKVLTRILVCTVMFLMTAELGWASLVLIGNASLKGKTVSKSEVKAIFQLTKKRIDDTGIVLIDAKISNRDELLQYLGETETDLKNLWLKARLTGKANPPQSLSEDDAVKAVNSTPNAIAVVNKEKVTGDAVILMTIK